MLQQYCLQRLARIQFDDHRLVDVASDIGTVGGLLEDAGQLAGVNVNPLRQALASGQIERLTDTPLRLCLFRSEEHPSELKSLMHISYAVFCSKKKKTEI